MPSAQCIKRCLAKDNADINYQCKQIKGCFIKSIINRFYIKDTNLFSCDRLISSYKYKAGLSIPKVCDLMIDLV